MDKSLSIVHARMRMQDSTGIEHSMQMAAEVEGHLLTPVPPDSVMQCISVSSSLLGL